MRFTNNSLKLVKYYLKTLTIDNDHDDNKIVRIHHVHACY